MRDAKAREGETVHATDGAGDNADALGRFTAGEKGKEFLNGAGERCARRSLRSWGYGFVAVPHLAAVAAQHPQRTLDRTSVN